MTYGIILDYRPFFRPHEDVSLFIGAFGETLLALILSLSFIKHKTRI